MAHQLHPAPGGPRIGAQALIAAHFDANQLFIYEVQIAIGPVGWAVTNSLIVTALRLGTPLARITIHRICRPLKSRDSFRPPVKP